MKPLLKLTLPNEDREELKRRVSSHSIASRDKFRATVILMRTSGYSKRETAKELNTSCVTVQKWVDRYRKDGLNGLKEKSGRGRKQSIPSETVCEIIEQATIQPKGKTRQSVRLMAKQKGVSANTVHTIWKKNGIKPHLTRTFKVSNDPDFVPKFWDVIGLYLNNEENSVVFCCDEKTQCQALERTQPGLPLGIGHIKTATHDYVRHGTTTLFAALDYASGFVHQHYAKRHTNQDWLVFLKKLEKATPKDLQIHIIADNYATHKHKNVNKWLSANPRIHMHFTPSSSSWMNLVERFFAEITRDCIRDGSFKSVKELEESMKLYIKEWNNSPTPFQWKASGEEILRKVNSARAAIGKPIYQTAH